jgi:hypothetical protein
MVTVMITLMAVALAVVIALALIARFPRPILRERLICPEKTVLAEVTFIRGEKAWGSFAAQDVALCTLFPGGSVTCDKRCLADGRK